MKWSWPAFGSGVAFGATACLLLVVDCAPDAPPALATARRAAEAATDAPPAPEPSAGRVVRSRDQPPTVAGTGPSTLAADEPSGPPAESHPGTAPTATAGTDEHAVGVPHLARMPLFVTFDTGEMRLIVAQGQFIADPTPSVNAAAAQSLARARRGADAVLADGRGVNGSDIDRLLASKDDGDLETAIGLLLRADPPGIARLLRIARDTSLGGSVRGTALLAAAEGAPQDVEVAAAVAALLGDRNVDARRTAVELLPRIGPAGADRAVALLRDGDFAGELLSPLARTVAASDRALDFLLSRPDPAVAFAVLHAIGETTPTDPDSRSRLLARLPDVVRTLLGSSEMLTRAGEAFAIVATAGHSAFLRSVAVDPSLPSSTRLSAVDAAIAAPACADGRATLLAATLSDGRSPVELLRAVVERVPQGDVADGGVKAALRSLAETHPNEWLREEARAKLQASGAPGGAGELRIVSGIYGKDGHTVDVTDVLASMVVGGRLVVEAGNELAGDPLVGIVKDLSVVYEWKGERRTRLIREYERLVLP